MRFLPLLKGQAFSSWEKVDKDSSPLLPPPCYSGCEKVKQYFAAGKMEVCWNWVKHSCKNVKLLWKWVPSGCSFMAKQKKDLQIPACIAPAASQGLHPLLSSPNCWARIVKTKPKGYVQVLGYIRPFVVVDFQFLCISSNISWSHSGLTELKKDGGLSSLSGTWDPAPFSSYWGA